MKGGVVVVEGGRGERVNSNLTTKCLDRLLDWGVITGMPEKVVFERGGRGGREGR